MASINGGKTPELPCQKFSKKAFFSYSPGEASFQQGYLGADKATLSGIFHLRYSDDEPIFAKKIQISFVGKEYVFFAGTLMEGQDKDDLDDDVEDEEQFDDDDDDDIVDTKTLSTHTAKRRIFGTSIVIWRSQSKGQYEGLKTLDLPFKFKLPSNLPHSFVMDKGCGRIYYVLKAVISRQPSINSYNNQKKMVKVLVPIVRYTIASPSSPSRWLIEQDGLAKLRTVSYDISLTHTTLGPGDSVSVPIKLRFHEPQVYLKKIFVGLKEYHELRTNKYETLIKKYIAEESIDIDNLPTSAFDEDKNEYCVDMKLNIPPSAQLVYSVESTYITVKHEIKVKISLGKAPDISISKIVKAEKIVTKDEVFPPLPPSKADSMVIESTPQQVGKQTSSNSPNSMLKLPYAPQKKNGRRLPAFFPLFNKIHILDPVTQKRISMQLNNNVNGPNLTYNSRHLTFH